MARKNIIRHALTLGLTGALVVPTAASAAQYDDLQREIKDLKAQLEEFQADTEEQLEGMDERADKWDLNTRFDWSGDIRNRVDFHQADTAEYYKATDVGLGVMTFVKAGPAMAAIGGSFANIGEMLTNLQPIMGDLATWRTNIGGFGITDQRQQDALYHMFTNQEVQGMLMSMAAMPTTAVTDAMQTPAALAGFMKNLSPAARASIFGNMGYAPTAAQAYENDTLYTTRLRLNMRVKATENVEIKARVVGYKAWGMQDSPTPETNEDGVHDTDSPYFLNSRSFDGTASRQPGDNKLVLDRAFMNWNNIGDSPIWFSIGRRPTSDGPPAQLRLGAEQRMATPINYMDYPFDGISLGYAYANLGGMANAPGRFRLCYGRGFESGPNVEDTGINDVDFGGFDWDIYSKGNRFINLQSFGAFNIFNVPGDTYFPNPMELADKELTETAADGTATGNTYAGNTYLDRANMGNIYHTSLIYMDKVGDLNFFVAGGWSRTEAKGVDELGVSLLNAFWNEPEDKDGYSGYAGIRYDIDSLRLKLGAEYNYGSKNWLAFTPGHDDMYSSKLQTRGSAYEVYAIYDLPGGDAIAKNGRAFMRLGYQRMDYDYTYSGMWLGVPEKIEDIKNDPLSAQFYAPIEQIDQVYLTVEAVF